MSFLVYKSSAGSGKTFTLVKEYLKIALGTDNPKTFTGILAITFTNKAANEMTNRILETLEEVSGVVKPMQNRSRDMMTILAQELKVSEKVIAERSRNTLKKIVHNYRDFSVGTIDSFVHKIIRSFAHEMGLNQQFEVELNTDNILRRAIDAMLNRVGIDPVLTKFITQYADSKFDKEASWKIDQDLFGFSKELTQTHNWYYLEKAKSIDLKTYHTQYAVLKEKVSAYEKTLLEVAQKAVSYALDGLKKSDYANRGVVIGYFEKITKRDFQPVAGSSILKVLEKDNWCAAKTKGAERDLIEDKKTLLTNYYNQIIKIREEGEQEYIFNYLLFSNLYKVALLSEIDKEVEKLKKANDLVLISDFNKLVGDVTRNEPIPFIYEKLGEKYNHFLFDEFQDTSLMQWQNMLPLVENSLSQGGTSLVVGDAKQSIYRWRGGMVEQFAKLPEAHNPYNDFYVTERSKSLTRSFSERDSLQKNFRSKANIVRFNNAFFKASAALLHENVGEYYADVAQEIKDPNSGGLVEFSFVHEKRKELSNAVIFEQIAQLIPTLKDQGYSLKDVAILTKVKKDTPALVEFLNSKGIEVISSESLLVKNSIYVKLIIAVLQHFNQPHEPYFMAEVLVRLNAIQPKNDFHSVIPQAGKITPQQFNAILRSWGYDLNRNTVLARPIYEMVSGVLEVFNLNEIQDNRLATWLNYIYTLSLKSGVGIFDVLDTWKGDEDKLSIEIPEDVDAVNVMTIHKAKGLDWPVVIVAEGNWSEVSNKHSIWVELPDENPIPTSILDYRDKLKDSVFEPEYSREKGKIVLDNLNALYVAFTRPADRLYVFAIKPKTDFFGSIYSVLENLELEVVKEFCNPDGKGEQLSTFSFGTSETIAGAPLTESNTETLNEGLVEIENTRFSTYQQKLKVKKNYIKWMNSAGERDYGNLVHKAFSFINTASDIPVAIEKLVKNGEVSSIESEAFKKLIEKVVNHDELTFEFSPNVDVKNEAEIILPNGDLLRPDRVVISDNKVSVIDFKTGMHKPSHSQQVLGYKLQLEKMGYTNVLAKLVYTQDAEVVLV